MTTLKEPSARPLAQLSAAILRKPATRWRVLTAMAIAIAVIQLVGNSFGLWWIALGTGIAAGLLRRRGAIAGLAIGTVVAWGAGIIAQSGGQTLGIAGVVSALTLGARALGWVIVALAVVYALLLALAGAWLGAAARRATYGHRRPAQQATRAQAARGTEKETENV